MISNVSLFLDSCEMDLKHNRLLTKFKKGFSVCVNGKYNHLHLYNVPATC
mgnify:CR=1 FL=1